MKAHCLYVVSDPLSGSSAVYAVKLANSPAERLPGGRGGGHQDDAHREPVPQQRRTDRSLSESGQDRSYTMVT